MIETEYKCRRCSIKYKLDALVTFDPKDFICVSCWHRLPRDERVEAIAHRLETFEKAKRKLQ